MWDGKTVPEEKYRLRWELHDENGNAVALSAWTPNDQGSFSEADKTKGTRVIIRGECLTPYEEAVLWEGPVSEVESIEYLVLVIRGVHHHVAMGIVNGDRKTWVLVSGEVQDEIKGDAA